MYDTWRAPLPGGKRAEEIALRFDRGREHRLLVLPPLFDEHNKTRHQTVETMRKLDAAGIDSFLPDLPGCNESLAPLENQSLTLWREAVSDALMHFRCSHLLAIRGGALLVPQGTPAFFYAPAQGKPLLRAMLRARTIAAREAGRDEKTEALLVQGREDGLELAGWPLGATMIRELEAAEPVIGPETRIVEQVELGGSPLWLRAEPGDDPQQAEALTRIVASGMLGS
ncbi:hypothetical protein A9995_01150 [Erythrobacter sp. QSSC1-22B]|nr:hypothetical protein A9995_01150 [Erythrobacter sp. QSSC1-22B]